MSKARIFATVLFLALLASPIVYKRVLARRETAGAKSNRDTAALASYGFHLRESATSSGIHFKHSAPTLDSRLDHIMPQIASMGAAVSVVDFDQDGWDDFYVTNSGEDSHNALYRNMHDGTFRDVAKETGLADVNSRETGVSMGAVWGDYDNDGYEDVLIYKWGKPELYHNDGGKRFTRVTEQAGLPPWVNSNTAIWFDYDNDGKLDLFLGATTPKT